LASHAEGLVAKKLWGGLFFNYFLTLLLVEPLYPCAHEKMQQLQPYHQQLNTKYNDSYIDTL
jgi:membrane protein insertase Oxa1/YidC/SpoIIIJ